MKWIGKSQIMKFRNWKLRMIERIKLKRKLRKKNLFISNRSKIWKRKKLKFKNSKKNFKFLMKWKCKSLKKRLKNNLRSNMNKNLNNMREKLKTLKRTLQRNKLKIKNLKMVWLNSFQKSTKLIYVQKSLTKMLSLKHTSWRKSQILIKNYTQSNQQRCL